MTEISSVSLNVMHIKGPLVFATITEQVHAASEAIQSQQEGCCLDLSDVERVDSSAMSFLLECMRCAKRHQLELTFANIPQDLQAMARMAGIAALLES